MPLANGTLASANSASTAAGSRVWDAGFDLRVLAGKGSGPDGRIVRIDVERAIAGLERQAAVGEQRPHLGFGVLDQVLVDHPVDEGPVVPRQPPSRFVLTTKNRSVSNALPGPIMKSSRW